MADNATIYLCRMHGRERPCLGPACGYLTNDGKCLIAGDDPPSQWTETALVIAVTQEQLATGDVESGFTGDHDGEWCLTSINTPTQLDDTRVVKPDLSGMGISGGVGGSNGV